MFARTLRIQSKCTIQSLFLKNLHSRNQNLKNNLIKNFKFKTDYFSSICTFGSGILVGFLLKRYLINSAKCENNIARKQFNFIADIAEHAAPSVVYIEIQEMHPFTGQKVPSSAGSGFIIDSNGLIITNAHVVGNRRQVSVRLKSGVQHEGYVEYRDNHLDLAIVRINVNNLPILKLGVSSEIRAGEWVVALGSPFSLTNTVTAGVVSTVSRQSYELGLLGKDVEYIQTDASINIGNSGGPLINLDGEAIGVNTMKVTAGISFAIPSDLVKEFLNDYQARVSGKVKARRKHYIGLTMLSLNPNIIEQLRLHAQHFPSVTYGVLIMKVAQGSPSQISGIQSGDVIINVNGKDIKSVSDIYRFVESGEKMKTTVIRDNQRIEFIIEPTLTS